MSITNDYHIAIIGPLNTVSGFKALGVETFAAATAAQALEQLSAIKRQNLDPDQEKKFAVVCIIESLIAAVDQAEYAKLVEGPLPAVVLLPGPEGSQGFALERLRALSEKAVGSSII
jgi:V/A-type H+-transporting ATPase subunit F